VSDARRMPVYFLVDTSDIAAMKRAEQAIEFLIKELRCDPYALEIACLSVIIFSSDARQMSPLTDLMEFKFDPGQLSPAPSLPSGLALLRKCLESEVRKATPTAKGDYKGLVVIFSSEELSETDRELADPDRQTSFMRVDCGSDFDFDPLAEAFRSLFRPINDDGSIRTTSSSLTPSDLSLPPPPPTITFVQDEPVETVLPPRPPNKRRT
jgi:hypothetical protein